MTVNNKLFYVLLGTGVTLIVGSTLAPEAAERAFLALNTAGSNLTGAAIALLPPSKRVSKTNSNTIDYK